MLTPSGNAINASEFGNFYKRYAKSCYTFNAKPNCEEADDLVKCYYNKSVSATYEAIDECRKRFPVANLDSLKMTEEELAKNETVACLVACFSEKMHMFSDDGKIDLSFINPHIDFEFNATEVVLQCDESNKQENQCQRKGNIFICVDDTFTKAKHEYYERKRLENN